MFYNKTINIPLYGIKKFHFDDCWGQTPEKLDMILVL